MPRKRQMLLHCLFALIIFMRVNFVSLSRSISHIGNMGETKIKDTISVRQVPLQLRYFRKSQIYEKIKTEWTSLLKLIAESPNCDHQSVVYDKQLVMWLPSSYGDEWFGLSLKVTAHSCLTISSPYCIVEHFTHQSYMIYNTRLISKFPMPRVSHQAALGRPRKIVHNSNSTGSFIRYSSILWRRERNIVVLYWQKRGLYRIRCIILFLYLNNRISIRRELQIDMRDTPSPYIILFSADALTEEYMLVFNTARLIFIALYIIKSITLIWWEEPIDRENSITRSICLMDIDYHYVQYMHGHFKVEKWSAWQ